MAGQRIVVSPFDLGPAAGSRTTYRSRYGQTALADPDARLVLNEYDVEFKGPRFAARRKALVRLLRSLRDRDVPLHAVGLQAHLFADREIDRDGLQAMLVEIKGLGLDVLITELDVIDYDLPGKLSERDALVASKAGQFLRSGLRRRAADRDPDLGPERSIHLGADLFQTPGRDAQPAAAARCRPQAQAAVRRHRGIQTPACLIKTS